MAVSTSYKMDWDGPALARRAATAMSEGVLTIAEAISDRAKEIVVYDPELPPPHLRDSIHVALADTWGETNATGPAMLKGDFAICEVGSWLDYACVIECGDHEPYLGPATTEVISSGLPYAALRAAYTEAELV